jgi:hypothetical protein
MSVNITNCILLRKGEKEILHFFFKIAQKLAKLFSMDRLVNLLVDIGFY